MIAKLVFPLADQRMVIVHLASFDWDFTLGTSVVLSVRDITLPARQVGSGNHEGAATVTLVPLGKWEDAAHVIETMLRSGEPIEIKQALDRVEWVSPPERA